MDLLKKADLEELADEATNPDIVRFLDEGASVVKTYMTGKDGELELARIFGGMS